MAHLINTNQEIINYLFGELPEAEQEVFEQAFIADPELLAQVNEVENDLIDDYVRGYLGTPLRMRFEQSYLTQPNRRRRVQVAETMQAKFNRSPQQESARISTTTSWRQRLLDALHIRQPVFGLAAAMAVLLCVLGGWWALNEVRWIRHELDRQQTTQTTEAERARRLEQQLAAAQQSNEELKAELEGLRNQTPQPGQQNRPDRPSAPLQRLLATLILTLGSERNSSGGKPIETTFSTLTIPPSARQVRLVLKTEAGDESGYNIVLRDSSGVTILTRSLRPQISRGISTFSLIVPTSKLSSGSYKLELSKTDDKGIVEKLGTASFLVEKK